MKSCSECGQQCCKSVIIQIDDPTSFQDWEEIRWKAAHKNVWVIKDNEDDWCVEFFTDCEHLQENGECTIYHKRPFICSEHAPDECIVNGEGEYYKLIFKTSAEVEEYLTAHPEAIQDEKAIDL
ncbi:MAG: YkgJ family cysteine cluster protein [Pseudomonadota bacterium]